MRFYPRRAHVVMVAFAVVVSCTKKDAPPSDTGQPGVPPAAQMPGTLTKPIDQYTGDEFYAFVQRLSFGDGHERDRRCKNAPGCEGAAATKRIKVQIDAVASQDSIAASNATRNGVVYMRALNRGDAEEARYSMQPGKNFEYYFVVTSTGNAMRWQLVQLDITEGARRVTPAGGGAFEGCNHPWVKGASADFKSCATARGASANDSTVRLGLALQETDIEPAWAACSLGCCIGQ